MELLSAGRLEVQQNELGRHLSRREQAGVCRNVWRDAGALRVDAVRQSFMQITKAMGHPELTCPKSWRHTFATLLQDANVDPLIRQITLGHKVSNDSRGALGMTSVYTHTRPETQKREIERALGLWSSSLQFATLFSQGSES
jgi:integrase